MKTKPLEYRISAGSSRVINGPRVLSKISNRPDPPESESKLLFQCRLLNNAILFKDIYTPDKAQSSAQGRLSTKVYFPYDLRHPEAGGETIFVSHPRFENAMATKVEARGFLRSEEWKHDKKTLTLLDQMPSFDPFILKDALMANDIHVEPEYLDITEQEWQDVQRYLKNKIAPMVNMAFKDLNGQNLDRIDVLVDKIWRAEDLSALMPLIKVFQLPAESAKEVVNGWKGIAYFEKQYHDNVEHLQAFAKWLKNVPVRASHGVLGGDYIAVTAAYVTEAFHEQWRAAQEIFKSYNSSYDLLFVKGTDATPFIDFIGKAKETFWVLSTALNKLYNVTDLWLSFGAERPENRLSAEETLELFALLREVLK